MENEKNTLIQELMLNRVEKQGQYLPQTAKAMISDYVKGTDRARETHEGQKRRNRGQKRGRNEGEMSKQQTDKSPVQYCFRACISAPLRTSARGQAAVAAQ